jgi:HTH-type transcriptional regulator/antitoxin HigA
MLIEAYDEQHETIPELRGIALLRTILEESDLKQRTLLPIFKHESVISAILAGRRHLTVAHIDQLATFFGLPHRLFFEREDASISNNEYPAIVSSFADSDNHDDREQSATHR